VPLYEYQCDKCAHRFEVIQKFSDAPLEVCPKCGGAVKKLLSSPAIQFKGSGWYITDYARKSDGGSAGSASSEAKGDAKSDAAKTESKAETKTETKADSKGTS
jgi:putative FmdB family regulatory protein